MRPIRILDVPASSVLAALAVSIGIDALYGSSIPTPKFKVDLSRQSNDPIERNNVAGNAKAINVSIGMPVEHGRPLAGINLNTEFHFLSAFLRMQTGQSTRWLRPVFSSLILTVCFPSHFWHFGLAVTHPPVRLLPCEILLPPIPSKYP